MNEHKPDVAYFSMEIGFHTDVPTYAGGLGMLAGDTVRSASDPHVPMAVSLLHRNGYFFQRINSDGWQAEEPTRWVVEDYPQAIGYKDLQRFHMNEGHAAPLAVELLRERRERTGLAQVHDHLDAIRGQGVFTTHTPVPAGHDQFDLNMVHRVLGDRQACGISDTVCHDGRLNMTSQRVVFQYAANAATICSQSLLRINAKDTVY